MREEKRSGIIHDALGFLDDEMIEEVEELRGSVLTEKKTPQYAWAKKWVAIAASICVLVLIGGVLRTPDEFTILESGDANVGDEMQESKPNVNDLEDKIDSYDKFDEECEDLIESTEEETEEVTEIEE